MSIQNTLKSFLQERNLTQAQFAELAGLNPCGLSKFLNREGGESIAERVYPYLHESKALIAPPTDFTDPEKEDGSMSASQQAPHLCLMEGTVSSLLSESNLRPVRASL